MWSLVVRACSQTDLRGAVASLGRSRVYERGHSEFHEPAILKARSSVTIQSFEMSGPNIDDIIEKAKQLCRLDGMLWSSLDFQNPMAMQSRTAKDGLAMPIGEDI